MNSKPPIIQRAKLALKVFQNGFPQRRPNYYDEKQAIPFVWPDWRLGRPTYHEIDMRSYIDDGFNINSLVYTAVMYKGRSSIIPRLKAYTGDPEKPVLCKPDHPLAKLIARPNPNQSWSEFQMLRTIYFNLTGDSFAYLHLPHRGSFEDAAYYALRSDRVYIIVPKSTTTIMGYLYVPEGRPFDDGIALLPQYVSHVKLPNPGDPLEGNGYGLSPLAPGHRTKEVDNAITDFIKIFWEKGAVVPGLLSYDIDLSDADAAIAKERWNEVYGGYKHWTDIGVMDKNAKYQRIGMDFTEMSFAEQDERNEARICCVAGTQIITKTGLKSIEEIGIGEYVLTHTGRWRSVTKTFETPLEGRKVYRIKAKGLDELELTGNHPVLAAHFSQSRGHRGQFEGIDWKPAELLVSHKRNQRGDIDSLVMPKLNDFKDIELEVEELLSPSRASTYVKDGLLYSAMPNCLPIPARIKLTPALGRLIGFYLAEGSTGSGKTMWYFHKDEINYHNSIRNDLVEVFGLNNSYIRKTVSDNCISVVIQNGLLSRFISCGTSRTKTIPEWAWNGNDEFRNALLMSWMSGDGHESKVEFRGTTASLELAWQMYLLAISLGYPASIREKSIRKGGFANAGPAWLVSWQKDRERPGSYQFHDGYWTSRIQSIEDSDYNGFVYNLEVDEDNSYVTTGGTVHNCGPFGVPVSLLDTRSSLKAGTENNRENDRRMFWEDIMLPEIGLFEDDYQYYLNDGNAFVKMDYSTVPALKRDIPKAVEAAYKLWTMGETRNNAYAIAGIDPVGDVPGADTSFLPISVMPVGSEGEAVATTNTGAATSEDEEREDEGKTKSRRKAKK